MLFVWGITRTAAIVVLSIFFWIHELIKSIHLLLVTFIKWVFPLFYRTLKNETNFEWSNWMICLVVAVGWLWLNQWLARRHLLHQQQGLHPHPWRLHYQGEWYKVQQMPAEIHETFVRRTTSYSSKTVEEYSDFLTMPKCHYNYLWNYQIYSTFVLILQ